MHLSIHSDCFLSDFLHDTDNRTFDMPRGGLMRGLAVIATAGLLVGLTCFAEMASPAAAGPVPSTPIVSQGTAVNLLHREVIGH